MVQREGLKTGLWSCQVGRQLKCSDCLSAAVTGIKHDDTILSFNNDMKLQRQDDRCDLKLESKCKNSAVTLDYPYLMDYWKMKNNCPSDLHVEWRRRRNYQTCKKL